MKRRILAVALVTLFVGPVARAQESSEQDLAREAAREKAEEERRERKEHDHGFRHMLDVLELVDAPVFERNLLQTKYEWTQKAEGVNPVAAEGTVFMVGAMLTYFFTW